MAAPQIRSIVVERDVWIGANTTVVSGVRIAEGCIIGANAVVTRDTEPFSLYAGVPARLKKRHGWDEAARC